MNETSMTYHSGFQNVIPTFQTCTNIQQNTEVKEKIHKETISLVLVSKNILNEERKGRNFLCPFVYVCVCYVKKKRNHIRHAT